MSRLILVAALLLCACTAANSPYGNNISHKVDTQFVSDSLYYFKDRYGLCYAAIGTDNGHFGAIVSITNIPCSALEPQS